MRMGAEKVKIGLGLLAVLLFVLYASSAREKVHKALGFNTTMLSSKDPLKIAVLGDSYVFHMKMLFGNESSKPGALHYFGKGGMHLAELPESKICADMVAFAPEIVVVLAGCNDLDSHTDIDTISDGVIELTKKLCTNIKNIKGLLFVEPVKRVTFRFLETVTEYEDRRRLLHDFLQRLGNMIEFHGMRRSEMSEDGVHGTTEGMIRLKGVIESAVQRLSGNTVCDILKEKIQNT